MASRSSSDAGSTPPSQLSQLVKKEIKAVTRVSTQERSRDRITIAVAHDEALESLREACGYTTTRRWFDLKPPPMLFTTPEDLQDTIDSMRLSPKCRALDLMVSPRVSDIHFDVPSHFRQLRVLRCIKRRDGGTLFVDGSSTYNGVRLDEWQGSRHKHHTLIIGDERGVRIKLNGIHQLSNWERYRSCFSDTEQDDLRKHFEDISRKSQWDEVKGAVSAIMGIVLGTAKFGLTIKGSMGGIYAKYTFGFHALEIAAVGAKMTAVATAAGSAVVLGVGVSTAIYFVPWEDLFRWLKRSLSGIWDKICAVWQRFEDWVKSWFGSASLTSSDVSPAPMKFSI